MYNIACNLPKSVFFQLQVVHQTNILAQMDSASRIIGSVTQLLTVLMGTTKTVADNIFVLVFLQTWNVRSSDKWWNTGFTNQHCIPNTNLHYHIYAYCYRVFYFSLSSLTSTHMKMRYTVPSLLRGGRKCMVCLKSLFSTVTTM